jgi:hypothetical protein
LASSQSKKKKPPVLLQQVFYISGKQGGGAAVLGEGPDIVTTKKPCVPTSLNINNLGKAAVLYLA